MAAQASDQAETFGLPSISATWRASASSIRAARLVPVLSPAACPSMIGGGSV